MNDFLDDSLTEQSSSDSSRETLKVCTNITKTKINYFVPCSILTRPKFGRAVLFKAKILSFCFPS
jgi:hypothetical protein